MAAASCTEAISTALGERVAHLEESATALRAIEAVETAAATIEANLALLEHEGARQKRVAAERVERERKALENKRTAKEAQRSRASERIARRAELEAKLNERKTSHVRNK